MVNTLLIGLGSIIGSVLVALGVILILYYTGALTAVIGVLQEIFNWVRSGIQWITLSAPKGVKVFLFIFFISVIGDVAIGTFVNMSYACVNENLRQTNYGFVGGVGMAVYGFFTGYGNETSIDYENWVLNNTHIDETKDVKSAEGMFYIRCVSDRPILTLWGLEIFNFRYWVMIFLIGFVISILWRD